MKILEIISVRWDSLSCHIASVFVIYWYGQSNTLPIHFAGVKKSYKKLKKSLWVLWGVLMQLSEYSLINAFTILWGNIKWAKFWLVTYLAFFYEHHEQRLNVMIALIHLLYMPPSLDTAGFTRSSCDKVLCHNSQILWTSITLNSKTNLLLVILGNCCQLKFISHSI